MKSIITLLLLLLSYSILASNSHDKIKLKFVNENIEILFLDTTINIIKDKFNICFSLDSQLCSIYSISDKKFTTSFNIFNINGDKINTDPIVGQNIYLANDGRFIVYNKIQAENGDLLQSTLNFFNRNGKKIIVDYQFHKFLDACFTNDGYFIVFQYLNDYPIMDSSYSNYRKVLLLNENFEIIAINNKMKYESILFVPPTYDSNNCRIIIPILINGDSLFLRKYNLNLDLITE
jgi:hypothetical protein